MKYMHLHHAFILKHSITQPAGNQSKELMFSPWFFPTHPTQDDAEESLTEFYIPNHLSWIPHNRFQEFARLLWTIKLRSECIRSPDNLVSFDDQWYLLSVSKLWTFVWLQWPSWTSFSSSRGQYIRWRYRGSMPGCRPQRFLRRATNRCQARNFEPPPNPLCQVSSMRTAWASIVLCLHYHSFCKSFKPCEGIADFSLYRALEKQLRQDSLQRSSFS
jgi:hypothetical protein